MRAGGSLGGLGTAYGAMAGGLVIGVVTELSTVWIPLELKFVWAPAALVAIPIGLAAGVGLALLLGLPTLRLRSDYFAITTIATAEILRFLIRSRSSTALTGGRSASRVPPMRSGGSTRFRPGGT